MNYHAPTNKFTVAQGDLQNAARGLLYAMGHIRDLEKKPRTPFKQEGQLTAGDYACCGIMDAANQLGIDLGAKRHQQLDLTNTG